MYELDLPLPGQLVLEPLHFDTTPVEQGPLPPPQTVPSSFGLVIQFLFPSHSADASQAAPDEHDVPLGKAYEIQQVRTSASFWLLHALKYALPQVYEEGGKIAHSIPSANLA